jgi:hypothetical protein
MQGHRGWGQGEGHPSTLVVGKPCLPHYAPRHLCAQTSVMRLTGHHVQASV